MVTRSQLLGVLAAALGLTGLVLMAVGQFLIAGVCFLGVSMSLYYRGVSS